MRQNKSKKIKINKKNAVKRNYTDDEKQSKKSVVSYWIDRVEIY